MLRMRRSVLQRMLAVGSAGLLTAGAAPVGPASAPRRPDRDLLSTRLSMRWLGVAGWELAFGGRSLLFDPYLSRMPYQGDDGALDPRLPLRVDRAAVARVAGEQLAGPPELILVSHGHFDHIADVPELLAYPQWRKRRIRTLCDLTSRHLLTALGAPAERVADIIPVRGGEYLQFDGYTVQVIPSLHSQAADHGYFAPGPLAAPLAKRPATLGELPEGSTLMYLVSFDGGPSVLLSGATNYIERELEGLRPDVAVISMTAHSGIHRYLDRLLEVLGDPPLIIPSHHDDMVSDLRAGATHSLWAAPTKTAVEALGSAASGRVVMGSRVLTPQPMVALDITGALR
ncbi:MBL fold metallo-hydrolase [Streptomyces finlayi]|uniref:MBL fold metallo-hydrolase n=2 Tax=Streptomyces finlayi TaxID=67296 RepID=A0A7G7BVI8_9ACTN|nr:MBL fold metallo-hydrolase [Streptomyces finlayi]